MININDPLAKGIFDLIAKQSNLPSMESLLEGFFNDLANEYNKDLPDEEKICPKRLKRAFEANGGFNPKKD